jgi:hypothetical protein
MRKARSVNATVLRATAAAVAVFFAAQLQAAEAGAPFEVKVNVNSGSKPPEIGLCRAVESGQTASVVCIPQTPAVPVQAAPVRRMFFTNVRFYISGNGNWLGAIDESMGLGTVTSWRVIRLADRDYLEMMVGW